MNWLSKIDDLVQDIRVAAVEEQQQQEQGTNDLIVDDPLLIGMHHHPQDDEDDESDGSYYDSESDGSSSSPRRRRKSELSSSSSSLHSSSDQDDVDENVTSRTTDDEKEEAATSNYSRTSSSSLNIMDASMDATLLGFDEGYNNTLPQHHHHHSDTTTPATTMHDSSTTATTTTNQNTESIGDGLARLVQQHLTNRLPELHSNNNNNEKEEGISRATARLLKKESKRRRRLSSSLSDHQYVDLNHTTSTTTTTNNSVTSSNPTLKEKDSVKSRQLPAIEPTTSLLSSNNNNNRKSRESTTAVTMSSTSSSSQVAHRHVTEHNPLTTTSSAEELATEQSSGDVTTESNMRQQQENAAAVQQLPTTTFENDSQQQQPLRQSSALVEENRPDVDDGSSSSSSSSGPPLLRRAAPPPTAMKSPSATRNTAIHTPSSLFNISPRPMSGRLVRGSAQKGGGGGGDSQTSTSLPLQNIELFSNTNKDDDLKVTFPLKPWMDTITGGSTTTGNRRVQNGLGVVHVRLVAAQRLPCPVASSVQAIVGLAPWKGRVRSQKVQTFSSSTTSRGVCTRWTIEQATTTQQNNQDEWMDDTAVGMCSMVHQYNGEDTPVPTIQLELVFHPVGFLEFSMCNLELSCEPLMQQPGVWKRNVWCQAQISKSMLQDHIKNKNKQQQQQYHEHHQPLICLDAAFFPATSTDDDDDDDDEADHDNKSVSSRVAPTAPADRGGSIIPRSRQMDSSIPRSTNRATITNSESSIASAGTGGTTLTSLHSKRKPHLLRIMSLWVPAECAVCKKNITGWHRAYRCETCSMDCCSDCRLQVDLQVPCQSYQSKEATETSIQRKMTWNNIVQTMAPPDATYEQKRRQLAERQQQQQRGVKEGTLSSSPMHHQSSSPSTPRSAALNLTGEESDEDLELVGNSESSASIGHLEAQIRRACLFSRPMVPDAEPADVFHESSSSGWKVGDYYVRISPKGSKATKRTRTVQNSGKPSFVGGRQQATFILNAPNYNMEFLVEVVNAMTDKPVGCTLLTVHSLLQLQRDEMITEHGMMAHVLPPFIFGKPLVCTTKRRRKLELRTGVKTGFGTDFFVAANKKTQQQQPGEIVGWVEMDVLLMENYNKLYGPNPVECDDGPDELNLDMFQIHVARISALIADVNRSIQSYIYLISWKNPLLTLSSFLVFLYTTLRFDTEYFGSLPIFWLICCMIYLAWTRKDEKNRFQEREKMTRLSKYDGAAAVQSGDANSNNNSTSSGLLLQHRPVGQLEVSIKRGKNLTTRDLGLPGGVCCRVYWDPLRYSSKKDEKKAQKKKKKQQKQQLLLQARHDMGETNSVYSVNPEWTNGLIPSDEAKRLQQILPTADGDDDHAIQKKTRGKGDDNGTGSITFPLLQPIRPSTSGERDAVELDSWSSVVGAIVFQVRFQDVLNSLPGFENVLGEVALPLSKVISQGEICGWYQVLGTGGSTHAMMPVSDESSSESDSPLIWIQAKWRPPAPSLNNELNATDREAAIVVAQELNRSAAMTLAASTKKLDLIGSSIGAFNTVRGIGGSVQNIQNMLGGVLDIVERVRNAFNFTDPYKSSFVLMSLVLVWLFFAFVSTRIICLTIGLAQYLGMLVVRLSELLPAKKAKRKATNDPPPDDQGGAGGGSSSPMGIWLRNAMLSLPTEEDLRRTYFWESRRIGERAYSSVAAAARKSRLEHLWKAQWYESLSLRTTTTGKEKDKKRDSTGTNNNNMWQENVFAVFHGRRLLWWNSTADFDDGELPRGTLVLAGHAGLAGLSPLEMRELAKEEEGSNDVISRVVAIFGRGKEGQQKLTLLLPTVESKDRLESIVLAATTMKQD